ncbi:MAG: phosphoribosylformylglycinamidine synthase subunit PurQ [Thermoanaerobaculia bacterium]
MKFSIVVFPGSNCEHDCFHIAKNLLGCQAEYVWHGDTRLGATDAVILPGGFAYGDYLRSGAMARFSPVMSAVREFAEKGGSVVGICNGFQVLCEARLLPGALRVNKTLRYLCQDVHLRCENNDTPWTNRFDAGAVCTMPIGHGEGNYTASPEELRKLEQAGRIVFRYCEADGALSEESNPNGSDASIAGICNEAGNVVGLMPHPDRCAEKILTNDAGIRLFESCAEWVQNLAPKVAIRK